MSDSYDVFDVIRKENAERLNVSEEELADMSYSEIEERMDLDNPDPVVPNFLAPSYPRLASDRYEVVGPEELQARREKVDAALGLSDQSYRAVVWQHRKNQMAEFTEYITEKSREFTSEARDFATDIFSSLNPENQN